MNRRLFVRRLLLTCVTCLLLLLAWEALVGSVRQLPRSSTLGQQVETIVQFGCGLLSLLTVFTCFWLRRWAGAIRAAWAIALVSVAGLSSMVWGPPMPLTALALGVVALLVALATIRVLRHLAPVEVNTGEKPAE